MNAFQWKCEPEAEALALRFIEEYHKANKAIETLAFALETGTSTRLFDWVDHIFIKEGVEKELEAAGYSVEHNTAVYRVYHHPGAQLPRIVVGKQKGLAVSVESIADFLMVRGLNRPIEGTPFSPFRRADIATENGVTLSVIERRGVTTIEPLSGDSKNYHEALELWKSLPRSLEDEEAAMRAALALAHKLVALLGQDVAAWVVLEVERALWQAKNRAGQIQKARQDRLGMGWANHDHHTFRSSRVHFQKLVELFELLGFHCRERFYAGAEAGWGAQVMENPRAKLVLFLDVDLSPEELQIDFAHEPLAPQIKLGTVGLWCALHGDSILQAGMHHLEAQFLFDALAHSLKEVRMMDPFSNFPYLKQAFTEGERWTVDPKRIDKLLAQGSLTPEEAQRFKTEGAIGSHMENLQRREGYKGFNQKNVSTIIKKTDPRAIPPGNA